MLVTAAHIRDLLNSSAESPVLHIERDDDTGSPTGVGVWAGAYVPHADVIAHRGEVVDAIGDNPDGDDIIWYLPMAQDEADRLLADQ